MQYVRAFGNKDMCICIGAIVGIDGIRLKIAATGSHPSVAYIGPAWPNHYAILLSRLHPWAPAKPGPKTHSHGIAIAHFIYRLLLYSTVYTFITMATAWNAWPTPPLSRSPSKYSRSPTSPLSLSPSVVDRSYLLSARLAASTPRPDDRDLPILPPEVLRRIIRAALALDPSIPDAISLDYPARSAVPSALPSPGINSSFPTQSFPFHSYAPNFPGFDDEDERDEAHQVPVAWDVFAGRAARRQLERRVQQRADVARTARNMMGVCRAWKVGSLP